MIDYTDKALFEQDSVDKSLTISSGTATITDADIREESLILHESLCEDGTLTFGGCEASSIELEISRNTERLLGRQITAALTPAGASQALPLGVYTVRSEKPSNIRAYKKIKAYDALYNLSSEDVADWWNTLPESLTVQELRVAFFQRLGLEVEETTLVNDASRIAREAADKISAGEIAKSLCEINGTFGRITRDGRFRFATINVAQGPTGFYPGSYTYPGLTLFPTTGPYTKGQLGETTLSVYRFSSVEYEDYTTAPVTGVSCELDNGETANFGSGPNIYQIKNRLLIKGLAKAEADVICWRLFDKIKGLVYTPLKVDAQGSPCIEPGDPMELYIPDEQIAVSSYVLSRTLTGIASLRDEFVAKGTEYQPEIQQKPREAQRQSDEDLRRTQEELGTLQDDLRTLREEMEAWKLHVVEVPDRAHVGTADRTFYYIPVS